MGTILIGTSQGLFTRATGSSSSLDLLGFAGSKFGIIRSVVVPEPEDPKRLFVSTTRAGVWRSDDGGSTWLEANDGLVYKEVWSLAHHPVTGDLYAGTGPACIFRSSDSAESWEELEGVRSVEGRSEWFLHLPPYFSHIRDITLLEEDPSLMVCAVEEGGVITTSDAGQSWHNHRSDIYADAHSVAIKPDDSKTVFVATGDGMYRSADGGLSFVRCVDVKPYATHVLTTRDYPDVVFVVAADNQPRHWRTDKGAGTSFFISYDAGSSWDEVTEGVPSYQNAGAYSAAWDLLDNGSAVVGLSDGSIWRVRLEGSAELWQSGLPTPMALTVIG